MKSEDNKLCFLLGANTPQGFVSRFDQLIGAGSGWRTYIIKGGPGCGKSTMMRKVATAFADDPALEIIRCASDTDSLDAVIVPGKSFCLADGNPPHALEPKYPGAAENILDFTSCWDSDLLYDCREPITTLTLGCSKCHECCCRFLAAASALLGDSYRIALDCVNTDKLNAYLDRLCDRELRSKSPGTGREKIRFLSAVTDKGVIKFTQSAKLLAGRIFLISDEHGAVSRLMLHQIRARALAAGFDIFSCYCPLGPYDKLEQLFIPALSLGFVTSNRSHGFDTEIDPYRMVSYQRFTDHGKIKGYKKRLGFNRKAAAGMLTQAETLMVEAKTLHGELETYYTAAMDFSKVDRLTEEFIQKMS